MRDFKHLFGYLKLYGRKHESLYFLSLMILFWAVFDGITTYITPLIITEQGLSKTTMGIIIGSSSVFGALFDFLLCKFFKNTDHRRIFNLMFILSAVYGLTLYKANSLWLFILAMGLWGVYYDLKNFGSFNFVARFTEPKEHTSSFGVISVFQAVGFLLAPFLAGLLIEAVVGVKPFIAAFAFLLLGWIVLVVLTAKEKKNFVVKTSANYNYKGFLQEIRLWRQLDKVLLPVLVMVMVLNIIDAFFWTIGPLLAESFKDIHQLAGLFLDAYLLPGLLVGWWVGKITGRFGKKRTAFLALFLGSVLLIPIGFLTSSLALIALVFVASLLTSLAWPAIRAAFADYIQETARYEKEIEGLEDFYTNLGFVIGPIMAGILADQLGNQLPFSWLGGFGALMALVLLRITPKKINVVKEIKK